MDLPSAKPGTAARLLAAGPVLLFLGTVLLGVAIVNDPVFLGLAALSVFGAGAVAEAAGWLLHRRGPDGAGRGVRVGATVAGSLAAVVLVCSVGFVGPFVAAPGGWAFFLPLFLAVMALAVLPVVVAVQAWRRPSEVAGPSAPAGP